MKISGERPYLWRAVDHEGEVLESYVTKLRDRKAALKFIRKSMQRNGQPRMIDRQLDDTPQRPARPNRCLSVQAVSRSHSIIVSRKDRFLAKQNFSTDPKAIHSRAFNSGQTSAATRLQC